MRDELGREVYEDGTPLDMIRDPFGDLADFATGVLIRPATAEELRDSRASESRGIDVNGRRCFVYEPGS